MKYPNLFMHANGKYMVLGLPLSCPLSHDELRVAPI